MSKHVNTHDRDQQSVEATHAARWLDSALEGSLHKASSIAALLGITEQRLSDWRRGRQRFAIDRLVPWLQSDAGARDAWLLAQRRDLEPRISAYEVRKRALGMITAQMRSQLANDFGETTDVISQFLEDTGQHSFGGL